MIFNMGEAMILNPKYKLLLTDLPETVESVSDDFTLLDLFRIINEANEDFNNIQLPIALGMNSFDDFYSEIMKIPEKRSDLDYLELHWRVDYDFNSDSNEDPTKAELFSLMDFGGIGKHECAFEGSCPNGCPKEDSYAVEMTPVCELAHLSIRLDPEVKMCEPYTNNGEILSRTGFTLTMHPTLYTFITSIFWELTFFGTPEFRDDQLDDMKETIKRIESGEEKMIPWEEVKKGLKIDEKI